MSIKDGFSDERGEDYVGWWIILTLVINLGYHFTYIFICIISAIIETCFGFYNDYYRFQKEKEHIENLEKINSYFKGALVGIKSYLIELKEK
jgi:hypothetical protein